MNPKFTYQDSRRDFLFRAEYTHVNTSGSCDTCNQANLVCRPRRITNDPVIHYGLIASANQVMRDGVVRDQLANELDIYCFEMEAAGIMDILPCLVIRGICNSSDSHKNKEWQGYASAAAAAYAKELLLSISPTTLANSPR
jgi:nucleoside phosphorylase